MADRFGHYAFRPLLRGVIQHGDGFTPDETTSYVSASSPPKHLSDDEVSAFFDRVRLVSPDLALFVVDTALCFSPTRSGRC